MTDSWRAEAVQLAKAQGVRRRTDPTLDADVTLVINDTLDILTRTYPDCRVYIYGSRLVGLAFNDSDVDLFIDLGKVVRQQDLPDAFGRVKNLLSRSGYFLNVFGISRARVPVITCEHKATRIVCDFNIHSKLCVSKSRLLSYYCDLHSEIKLAMLVVKVWAKRHSDTLVSNYALTMMLIFYLAQKSMVPPPLALLRSVEIPEFEGNWQRNFEPLPFTCQSTENIKKLIKGFFQFMATYNFGLEMMKVQSTQSLPKSAACSPLDAMWVQDPLELDHNTTKNITLLQCQAFQDLCAEQVVLCDTPDSTLDQLLSSPTLSTRQPMVVPTDLAEFRIYPNGFKMSIISSALWHKLATKVIRDVMLHVMFCVEASCEEQGLGKLEIVYYSKCATWHSRKLAKRVLAATSKATTPLGTEVEISQYLKQKEVMPYLKNADTLHFKMGLQFSSDPTYINITLKEIKSWKNLMFNFSQFLKSWLQQFVDKGFSKDYSKDLITLNCELTNDDTGDSLSPPGKIMKVTNNKNAAELDKITSLVSTLILDKPPPIPAALKQKLAAVNNKSDILVLAPQYHSQAQKVADNLATPSIKAKTGVNHEKLVAARKPDTASLLLQSILKVKTQRKDDKACGESTRITTKAEMAHSSPSNVLQASQMAQPLPSVSNKVTVNSVKPDLNVIHECLNAKSFKGTNVPLSYTMNKLAGLKITITGDKRLVSDIMDDPLRNRATPALFTSASTRGLMQNIAERESLDEADELDLLDLCTNSGPIDHLFEEPEQTSFANKFSVPPPTLISQSSWSAAKQNCPHDRLPATAETPCSLSAKYSSPGAHAKVENLPPMIKNVRPLYNFKAIPSSAAPTRSFPNKNTYQVNPPLPLPKLKYAPNKWHTVEKIKKYNP